MLVCATGFLLLATRVARDVRSKRRDKTPLSLQEEARRLIEKFLPAFFPSPLPPPVFDDETRRILKW